MQEFLYHHGIKGQRWGVRRYQYADGTLTPAGKKRYYKPADTSKVKSLSRLMGMRAKELTNSVRSKITGKQYVDGYLKEGTKFSRIQTSDKFENFAFYATYKKHDTEEYMGLFGKNLISRANRDAVQAEKDGTSNAAELRDKADNIKVYQVKLEATKKLKIPSDENASDIAVKLLDESDFKNNVIASIQDSKEKMKRPTQQILFNQAQKAIDKHPAELTYTEKVSIYKALNLTLVNHNKQEIAAQDRFYGELKKKGYNALLDYNDKEYSSYHAKRPMIVFDVDSVKLQSVSQTDPKVINKLYTKYNTERIVKEIPAETVGLLGKLGKKTVTDCRNYVNKKTDDYLSG